MNLVDLIHKLRDIQDAQTTGRISEAKDLTGRLISETNRAIEAQKKDPAQNRV